MPKLIKNHLIGTIRDEKGALLESMIIFTAIELCGSFLTGDTGKPQHGRNNFKKFWGSKYMKRKYYGKADLLYDIVRHGVNHSFIAKGGVIPSGKKNKHKHLMCYREGIFLYMPEFKKDVISAIKKFLNDLHKISNRKLRKNYCSVLSAIKNDGENRYRKFIENKKIKIHIGNFGKGDIENDIEC